MNVALFIENKQDSLYYAKNYSHRQKKKKKKTESFRTKIEISRLGAERVRS